ncbi:MAG: EamA family transporter [Oceanospirillaceae bacterium]|jgi:O-acetylserine/cysteine efflux transporter|nr:EamA family transporter [Oceanospirillaceae bacterium]MBT4443433.1 EamA family transporter [Oceanospirillaceae bacterium]MBT6077710.1 EamA family transporter [Oceanospirillaceae bacterium]
MKQIDWLAKPALGATLVAAIWGFNIVGMKIALSDMDPLLFTAARFFLLALVLLPFVKISHQQIRPLLPIALVMGLGHFYLLAVGISIVPGVIASVCFILGAPFSALLSYLFLNERLSQVQSVAIVTATLGAMLPTLLIGQSELQWGILIVVLSTFMWAVGNIQIRKLNQLPLLSVQFWIAIITAPLCFIAFLLQPDAAPMLPQFTTKTLLSLTYVVFCSSILSYSLWYGLIHRHGMKRLAGFVLLQPVFTLTFGFLLLGESLTLWQLVGSSITLTGIYIYNQQNQRSAQQ